MGRRGESIFRRRDGRWEARYEKFRDEEGKILYGYCYAGSYEEVKRKRDLIMAKIMLLNKSDISGKRRLFMRYADEWFMLHQRRLKESTMVKYYSNMKKHIEPYFGKMTVGLINTSKIAEFNNYLCEKGLEAKTIKDILVLLANILKYIARENDVSYPLAQIIYPKVERKSQRVLTVAEQSSFMHYLTTNITCAKFAILLALLTGMRLGEVCALRWGDIDFRNKVICVTKTLQRIKNLKVNAKRKTKLVITSPKTAVANRLIPIPDEMIDLCEKMRAEDEYFICTNSTRCLEPRSMQYRLKYYLECCNIFDVHFHTLRHTFTSRCGEANFEIKALSEVLGHANSAITLENYMHPSIESKRSNMNKVLEYQLWACTNLTQSTVIVPSTPVVIS